MRACVLCVTSRLYTCSAFWIFWVALWWIHVSFSLNLAALMPCAPMLFCVPAISRTIIGLSNDFALTWPIEVKVTRGSPIRWRVVKTPPIANQHFPRVLLQCTAHHTGLRCSYALIGWEVSSRKNSMKMGANSTRILILVHIKKYRWSIDFKDFSCMYIPT